MSAHLVLQEHAEVISGSVKVDDFLKKIMISNKEMAAGKATVLAMTAFRNNFAEASNYLANFVAAQLWGQHNISYMGRGRRRGGHGRGCGECYRGWGGRGQGQGRRGKPGGGAIDIISCSYTPDKWQNQLSVAECEEVKRLRQAKSQQNTSSVKTTPTINEATEAEPQNTGDQFAHKSKKLKWKWDDPVVASMVATIHLKTKYVTGLKTGPWCMGIA